MTHTTVAIIGTSGRNDDALSMTQELFASMQQKAVYIMENDFGLDLKNVALVSGGAAWADHVAVELYINNTVSELRLHLPCEWTGSRHLETSGSWKVNPGRLANQCHVAFSKVLGVDTLHEIEKARWFGAYVNTGYSGFHDRNKAVANVDYLIAFTWGTGTAPETGGTLDTWKKAKNTIKVHVPLSTL